MFDVWASFERLGASHRSRKVEDDARHTGPGGPFDFVKLLIGFAHADRQQIVRRFGMVAVMIEFRLFQLSQQISLKVIGFTSEREMKGPRSVY